MKVFVYGSLMSGFGANQLLDRCEFKGEGYILGGNGLLVDSGNGWPGFVRISQPLNLRFPRGRKHWYLTSAIRGEIYEVPSALRSDILRTLDGYEGYPRLFGRRDAEVIRIDTANRAQRDVATVYDYQMAGGMENQTIIPTGDWRAYVNKEVPAISGADILAHQTRPQAIIDQFYKKAHEYYDELLKDASGGVRSHVMDHYVHDSPGKFSKDAVDFGDEPAPDDQPDPRRHEAGHRGFHVDRAAWRAMQRPGPVEPNMEPDLEEGEF